MAMADQLMYSFQARVNCNCNEASNTNDVMLPHVENHACGIWHHLEAPELGSHTYHTNPAMQGIRA